MLCLSVPVVFGSLLFVFLVLASYTTKDVDENAEPWVRKESVWKDAPKDGIERPKICSVTYEVRYKAGSFQLIGDKYISSWVATCRGYLIGQSAWYVDRYTTCVELRKNLPLVGSLLVPSLKRQQLLLDQTREIGSTNYWKLIEALEAEGWECRYSSDGGANSMVKTTLTTTEPQKPRKMS